MKQVHDCVCVPARDFSDIKSRVYVIGPEDGQARLADIARQLSADVAMQRLSLESLTVSYVDSVVQGKFDSRCRNTVGDVLICESF